MPSIRAISILMLVTLVFSGCTAGRTAFNKAEKLERDGNLDAALVKYAEVAAANPDVGEYRVKFLNVTDAAAKAHHRKGEAFFALQRYDDALREYQSAYAIDPTQIQARVQSELVLKLRNAQVYYLEGVEFEKNRKPREAMLAYQHALEFEPGSKQVKEALDRLISNKRQKLDGYELNLKSTKPITLKFKDAKIKEVFNILSQLSGINFVFDEAVKDVNISLFLENATFQQAMEIITGMNKLDKKVLNESTIIIYPRVPDKLKQYEELFLQTFYLNKLDAKKAVNLIRTMLQVKKIYVNEEMNALVIRDTPEVIEVARKILEANDVPDAEVLLEVEVFELSKQNAETFGLLLSKYSVSANVTTPAGSFFSDTLGGAATTTPAVGTTPATPIGVGNLLNAFAFRGYNGYLTVPNATFNFGKTLSNGETLSNPKIRVKNREKAKFNVGTRVPITTTSSPSGGGVSVNVQYVDVGVKVNAEPTIQLNNEVSIKLGLEVSSILRRDTIGTDQATTVVTIGTRNLDTVLSLKDGETSIIGGLIQKTKTDSKSKVFLLGDIPFIGSLFTNTNDSADKTELLLAITPRIVRGVTVPESDVAAFWSGREESPSSEKPYSSFNQEPEFAPFPDAGAPAAGVPGPAAPATALPGVSGRRPMTQAAGRRGPVQVATVTPAKPAEAAEVVAPAVPDTAVAPLTPVAPVPVAPVPVAPVPVGPVPVGPVPVAKTPVDQVPAAKTPAAPAAPAPVPVPAAPAPAAPAPAPAPAAPAPAVPAAPAPPAPGGAAGVSGAAAGKQMAQTAPAPASTSTIALSLGVPSSVNLNEQFSVQVNASGARDLYSAVFVLTYDPKKIEVVGQTEGALLKQNNTPTSFQAFASKQKGELWVSESRLSSVEGASGDGAVAVVTFKAIGKGASGIGFSNTKFSTKKGGSIPVTAFKSVVEVK